MIEHVDHCGADITILELCAGYGGLDLGIELAVPESRCVCGVECEASCAVVLDQAMRSGPIAPFPVWNDLRTFDGRRWRGCVDIIAAGYPCQPFSQAGKRRGADDPRHLWPHVARVIGEVGPECVFLENVEGHVGLGLREVVRDLEGMGYRCAVGLFTARGVGAPHRRRRVFIVGMADAGRFRGGQDAARAEGWGPNADKFSGGVGDTGEPGREGTERAGALRQPRAAAPGSVAEPGGVVGDSERADAVAGERGEQGEATGHGRRGLADAGGGVVDTEGGDERRFIGRGVRSRQEAEAQRKDDHNQPNGSDSCRPLWPPGPGEQERWADIIAEFPDFAPALVEHPTLGNLETAMARLLRGVVGGSNRRRRRAVARARAAEIVSALASSATQSVVRGVADGGARRLDRMRMLGNGVVPLEAAYAFVTLAAALEHGERGDGVGER